MAEPVYFCEGAMSDESMIRNASFRLSRSGGFSLEGKRDSSANIILLL